MKRDDQKHSNEIIKEKRGSLKLFGIGASVGALSTLMPERVMSQNNAQIDSYPNLIVFETVNDMISGVAIGKIEVAHNIGQYYKTLGYHSVADGGAGIYKVENDNNETLPNNMDILGLSGGVSAILLHDSIVFPEQFGAYGDGIRDDTSPLKRILEKRVTCNLQDNKSYLIQETLVIQNGDFDGRYFFSQGNANIIASDDFQGDSLVIIRQGSGSLNVRSIEGITFKGSKVKPINLLELRDPTGLRGYRCRFIDGASGLLLHNYQSNGFTEAVVFYDSWFKNNSVAALEYRRKDGTDSFHGSGLQNCWINTARNSVAVLIGNGCLPYNSPMSFTCFAKNENGSIVFQADGRSESRPPMFRGDISTEGEIVTLASGDRNVYLVGGVTGLGAQDYGRLYECYSVRSTGPQAGNIDSVAHFKPRRREVIALQSDIVKICPSDAESIVHIRTSKEYYFKIQHISDIYGGSSRTAPEVFIGNIQDFEMNFTSGGIEIIMPSDGTLKIVTTYNSLRWSALPENALESKV